MGPRASQDLRSPSPIMAPVATQSNKKKLHSVEEESLLMQYHSINIEILPKRIKNKV